MKLLYNVLIQSEKVHIKNLKVKFNFHLILF